MANKVITQISNQSGLLRGVRVGSLAGHKDSNPDARLKVFMSSKAKEMNAASIMETEIHGFTHALQYCNGIHMLEINRGLN